MPQTLAVVTLQKLSLIPEDAIQNTFAFAHTPALDATGADTIRDLLKSFYNDAVAGPGTVVNGWLSLNLTTATDANTIELYDITGHLSGTPHGSPTFTRRWSLGGTGSTAQPNEVAACLSFHSVYGTDVEFTSTTRPRARDRGRIYLGPLATGAILRDSTTQEPFLHGNAISTFTEAATVLKDNASDFTWSVWSRVDATLKPVTGGWVDNAFDTQRRRGNAATQRTTF